MKVNDTVKIISGDNKGKEAKIVKVDRKNGNVMLEGIGMVERHMKKTYYNPQGGKKTIHVGIDMSNVELVKSADVKSAVKKVDKKSKDVKAKKGAK